MFGIKELNNRIKFLENEFYMDKIIRECKRIEKDFDIEISMTRSGYFLYKKRKEKKIDFVKIKIFNKLYEILLDAGFNNSILNIEKDIKAYLYDQQKENKKSTKE
jgi:hypothetical protein